MLTGQTRNGMLTATMRTEQVSLPAKRFLIPDERFKIPEFLHFCSKMLRPEPKRKEKGKAPCMIVFCSFEQQFELNRRKPKKHGLNNYINLRFIKEKLFSSSLESKYARCRKLRICDHAIP